MLGWSFPTRRLPATGDIAYLAAWGYALKKSGGDEKQARDFVAKPFANVPVLDTGGRGATTTFAGRGIGDVLLTFENEAALVQKQFPNDQFEVILPSVSILAENPVAWVDHNVQRHHTEAVSRAYLEYLYSDAGQELAAKHFFRPINQAILARYSTRYKPLNHSPWMTSRAVGRRRCSHISPTAGFLTRSISRTTNSMVGTDHDVTQTISRRQRCNCYRTDRNRGLPIAL